MTRETEKALRDLMRYLDEEVDDREAVSEEDLNALIDQYMQEYNAKIDAGIEQEPQTADDYVDLAYDADSDAEAKKYLRKAIQLDKNNLDAITYYDQLKAKDALEYKEFLEEDLEIGNQLVEKYMDQKGEFWSIFETRPYMRMRCAYFNTLIELGMFKLAIQEGKYLLELCEGDNLGIRYQMMHLYALLEMKEEALDLYNHYEENSSMFLFPLSILYYKNSEFDEAKKYLDILIKENRDTKKVIRTIYNGEMDKLVDAADEYGYRPGTSEEIITGMKENSYLYLESGHYIEWAYHEINKRKNTKKKNAKKH